MHDFHTADLLYKKACAESIDSSDLDTIIRWPLDKASILFACADQVRRRYFEDQVEPCTLMNIKSGNCSEDCAFCAQSAHNQTEVQKRALARPEEIIEQCRKSHDSGFPFCVVSSGKKLSTQEIASVCEALKECEGEKHASLGILDDAEFDLLREAGITCYNHNLETSRTFFPSIVTTHSYDQRVDTVKRAKRAGLHVCCGGIFGLGESWDDRKEFCLQLQELRVDTVPINFLNAIPGTRVAPPKESPLELLKIVSMFRLAMPRTRIKVCGGREVNLGSLQSLIFFAGANGYVSGGYLTTPGAGIEADDRMIQGLGLRR